MAGSNFYTKINSTLWVAFTDESGYATHAKCTGTPPTTASLFLHGCQMIQTDTATGAKALFENIGSTAVPEWNLLGEASVGEIPLTTGSVLIGAAGVGSALDVKGSGKILVGNGTTATSVSVSGDATLSAAGAVAVKSTSVGGNALTAVANAVTTTLPFGVVTSSTANLGAATAETLTITYAACAATSRVLANINAPGTGGNMIITTCTPSAGSFTVTCYNMNPGAAMSSVYSFSFAVLN